MGKKKFVPLTAKTLNEADKKTVQKNKKTTETAVKRQEPSSIDTNSSEREEHLSLNGKMNQPDITPTSSVKENDPGVSNSSWEVLDTPEIANMLRHNAESSEHTTNVNRKGWQDQARSQNVDILSTKGTTDTNWRTTKKNDTCWSSDAPDTKLKQSNRKIATEKSSGFEKGKNQPDYFNRNTNFTERRDKAFQEYKIFARNNSLNYEKVREDQKDLFTMPKEFSLAHCVAEDMRMGSGIAVNFKRDFKQQADLLNQRQRVGGLAVLEDESDGKSRYVYYLVTKKVSTGKPTLETLFSSLTKMRDHIRENGVTKLAMPRIGCGLDRLEWSDVKPLLEFIFQDVQIEIVVCNFQQTEESQPRAASCKVVHVPIHVKDIDQWTIILYFSTEDGFVSEEMEQLDKKFNFLSRFRSEKKNLGDVVRFEPKVFRNYLLYGCIVRKNKNDFLNYSSLAKCVLTINKNNKKDLYEYVAFQVVEDRDDDCINDKIITVLRNYFRDVEVYVCWEGNWSYKMPVLNRTDLYD